jgi:3-methyladenine DNA glycosylase/8-oxoguanine DNA glycosylase
VTAEEHLRHADPILAAVMDEVVADGGAPALPPKPAGTPDPNMPTDRYGEVMRAIVSQNISEIASRAIWMRLLDRFGGRPPSSVKGIGPWTADMFLMFHLYRPHARVRVPVADGRGDADGLARAGHAGGCVQPAPPLTKPGPEPGVVAVTVDSVLRPMR